MSITAQNAQHLPRILVLGMGGTIAGLAANPSHIGQWNMKLANINSRNLTEPLMTIIGQSVREALGNPMDIGVVITHGTDAIEEAGVSCSLSAGNMLKI
ncbi:asparaginase domain-containing protein [Polynucleobacter necessarius]|uniref:asparaginase domain-containing protein n=1 Tax=Polynucleobacter necessarius TaxID=576610 RepID=UPI0018D59928|nr:asparaginase domain-containing protein [Polynucleobacter necessarius]